MGDYANIVKFKAKQRLEKATRLIDGRPKHSDERLMDEQEIEDYIKHMKDAIPDDPKVTNCLLKWLELKKKYSQVDANTTAELDMGALKEFAKTPTEPDEPGT